MRLNTGAKTRLAWIGLAWINLTVWAICSAQAQDETEYVIEVLVLQYLNPATTAYRWPGEPDTSVSLDLLPPLRGEPARQARSDSRLMLREQTVTLADAWDRLRRSGDYRPITHLAWQQPALQTSEAQPVRVRNDRIVSLASGVAFSDTAPNTGPVIEVDGLVTFEQRRFQHIRVDLAFHMPNPIEPEALPLTSTAGGLGAGYEPPLPYQTFRITDSQQVRAGRVYYFDHRQFGVLVSVDEIPQQAP